MNEIDRRILSELALGRKSNSELTRLLNISPGKLYPALLRLQAGKLIDATWGDRIRIYFLTYKGIQALENKPCAVT